MRRPAAARQFVALGPTLGTQAAPCYAAAPMATFVDPNCLHDTIVAESTARGAAAVAVVRLSGPEAHRVAAALCAPVTLPPPHKLARRQLSDGVGAVLDDALVVVMPGPRSFTGEDVAELHLHGSPAVVDAVVAACLHAGARPAEAGEFTRRAFVRGKVDLTQAEAIGALVAAQDERARRAALRLLDGRVGQTLRPLLAQLEGVVAAWRAGLDFPDEVEADATMGTALAELCAMAHGLRALLGGAQQLRQDGPQVVLLGGANVGKSTLLNTLAGKERALVDAAPGTTRDALALDHAAGNVHMTVWDTAGLRENASGVEARGIALARARAAEADLRLWLTGADAHVWPGEALGEVVVVGSQADRTDEADRRRIEGEARRRGHPFAGWICAPSGEGIAPLEAFVANRLRAEAAPHAEHGAVLASRHRRLLTEAADALEACAQAAVQGLPLDCLLAEVELAASRLGQVLGKDVDAAVIDRIFADFCLGK